MHQRAKILKQKCYTGTARCPSKRKRRFRRVARVSQSPSAAPARWCTGGREPGRWLLLFQKSSVAWNGKEDRWSLSKERFWEAVSQSNQLKCRFTLSISSKPTCYFTFYFVICPLPLLPDPLQVGFNIVNPCRDMSRIQKGSPNVHLSISFSLGVTLFS